MTTQTLTKLLEKDLTCFVTAWCPYCRRITSLFDALELPVTIVDLDKIQDGYKLRKELTKISKTTSVPQFFVKGKFVGGCDDTMSLHRKGKLLPYLKKQGVLGDPEESTETKS